MKALVNNWLTTFVISMLSIGVVVAVFVMSLAYSSTRGLTPSSGQADNYLSRDWSANVVRTKDVLEVVAHGPIDIPPPHNGSSIKLSVEAINIVTSQAVDGVQIQQTGLASTAMIEEGKWATVRVMHGSEADWSLNKVIAFELRVYTVGVNNVRDELIYVDRFRMEIMPEE